MIEELGQADIWHQKHPKERDYNLFSKVHRGYSRIDLSGSVVMSVNLRNKKQLKQWRLNILLLNNPDMIQCIEKEWINYVEHND